MTLVRIGSPDTLRFHDDPWEPGHYLPDDTTWVPVGSARYLLEATFGEERLWAQTVVPDTFSLGVLPRDVAGDTLTREDPHLVLVWSASDSAGGYALCVVSLAPRDSLVPLDPDVDPEEAREDSLGRSVTWLMRHDQRMLTVPWIIFQWAGPYRVSVMATSREYYEWSFAWMRIRSGADIVPPTNVHGGIGIVAGFSRHRFEFTLRRSDG